jgi:hypothetical protein
MIDRNVYNLTFYKKDDVEKEEYFGRKITGAEYVIFNPRTGTKENFSTTRLRKNFKSHHANKRVCPVRLFKRKVACAS